MLALLPVWFPWVLKPVLHHYDLEFSHYDRLGYTQFALNEVAGRWDNVSVTAQRVEGVLPLTWAWRKVVGGTNESPFLTLKNGDVVITPAKDSPTAVTTTNETSLDEILNVTVQTAAWLKWVLPAAELTNCTIHIATHRLTLTHAEWRDGQLRAEVRLPDRRGEIQLAGRFQGTTALELSVQSDEQDAALRGEFTRTTEGWRWAGEADWLTNRATLTAQFATNGWWPIQARVDCREWGVPATWVRPYGYEDLNVTVAITVSSNQFSLQAGGRARPTAEFAANGFPIADFSLAVDGNSDGVNLQNLNIQSPWLKAALTNTVGLTWGGELLAQPAELHLALDLDQLPGAALTGRAEGLVRVTPQGQQSPVAQFDFTGRQISWGQVAVDHVGLKGEFATSRLRVDQLMADSADGSKLAASGAFDFHTNEVVAGAWQLSGHFLETLLPGSSYESLTGSGHVAGPLTNLVHGGEVTITDFQLPGLKPLQAHAQWSGHNLRLENLAAELDADGSTLAVGGNADFSALTESKILATVTNLSLSRGNEELYALSHPCDISFNSGGINASPRQWTLAVDAFDWQGANRQVALTADLAWPARGNVQASLTNVVLADFAGFLTNEIPDASLTALAVAAQWTNGPVHATVSVSGALTNHAGQPFVLKGELMAGDMLSIQQLTVDSTHSLGLSVTGNVPVRLVPGRIEGWLDWDKSQAIALNATLADDGTQPFTVPMATHGEVLISKPELSLRLSGTVDEPAASVQAAVALVTWQPAGTNALRSQLENLQLNLEVHRDRITLDALDAKLDGQLVQATGDWPLAADDWADWWTEKKWPDWSQARGHLQFKEVQMAAVARYLPEVLAPEGRMNATLELKPGRQVAGRLWLTNAATRPVGDVTALREIAAQIRFDGQRAELSEFRGEIGGQPVQANGFVDLRDWADLKYEVNLRGTNVPVSRSVNFLLRGDFNLQLRSRSDLPPMVSGQLNLRDGLFLQHASTWLTASSPKGPTWHPPYFSVTNQPLADWRLEVTVSGDRFLRVRTPVFNGVLSANAQVRGPLREPVVTGDVRINSGRITFPFGTLTVADGYAGLNGNDPRGPTLQLQADGRSLNYNVNLNMSGSLDGAKVEFSSTPPLSSEEILLLLTAGEVPHQQYTFSTSAKAGRMATFLGKDLFNRFSGEGTAEDRLIINTGENVSEDGKLTYSVEYLFTDRWSIVGEYDRFNAYNAMLKWRIISR